MTRKGKLKVETPNGVVLITVGLDDMRGNRVDSICLIPDAEVVVHTGINSRMIKAKG